MKNEKTNGLAYNFGRFIKGNIKLARIVFGIFLAFIVGVILYGKYQEKSILDEQKKKYELESKINEDEKLKKEIEAARGFDKLYATLKCTRSDRSDEYIIIGISGNKENADIFYYIRDQYWHDTSAIQSQVNEAEMEFKFDGDVFHEYRLSRRDMSLSVKNTTAGMNIGNLYQCYKVEEGKYRDSFKSYISNKNRLKNEETQIRNSELSNRKF